LTPYIGGATDGTVKCYSQMMVEDIESFIDGKLKQAPLFDRMGVWG
jgi:lactate dehydrogenase-like 2-hydroxyacid dehydrogenase